MKGGEKLPKLNYEIREYCEGKNFGEGLWLFLNGGLCRGYTKASMKKYGFTPESVREQFRNEVEFFGGTLAE